MYQSPEVLKRLLEKLSNAIIDYLKTQIESETYFSYKAVTYISGISQKINYIFTYYEKKTNDQYLKLYREVINNIKSTNEIYSFILKTKKEKRRNIIN